MKKNVLVISTSLRARSNSEAFAAEFARGAQEAGNTVEQVSLRDVDLAFCKGCLACQARGDGHCFMRDDADALVQKMATADVLAFATPVYYYGMSGQMKALLDRANPLFCVDYAFRDVYLLAAAAEDEGTTFDRTRISLEGWVYCFPKARLAGAVYGGGLEAPGDAASATSKLAEAFALGAAV